MAPSEEKLSRLRSLYDLARGSDEFEGGVTIEEELEALEADDIDVDFFNRR